jgi:hypothetical protein
MPSAAIACCSRASPPKLLISMSTPCCLKMPVRAPTSAGTKENASRPAFPTRSVSAGAETTATADKIAETTSNAPALQRARPLAGCGHTPRPVIAAIIPSPLASRFPELILAHSMHVRLRHGRR